MDDKQIEWMGSSKKDLLAMPEAVPDIGRLARCTGEAFEELKRSMVAPAAPAPAAARPAASKKPRRASPAAAPARPAAKTRRKAGP